MSLCSQIHIFLISAVSIFMFFSGRSCSLISLLLSDFHYFSRQCSPQLLLSLISLPPLSSFTSPSCCHCLFSISPHLSFPSPLDQAHCPHFFPSSPLLSLSVRQCAANRHRACTQLQSAALPVKYGCAFKDFLGGGIFHFCLYVIDTVRK